jgi:hypothetical protein
MSSITKCAEEPKELQKLQACEMELERQIAKKTYALCAQSYKLYSAFFYIYCSNEPFVVRKRLDCRSRDERKVRMVGIEKQVNLRRGQHRRDDQDCCPALAHEIRPNLGQRWRRGIGSPVGRKVLERINNATNGIRNSRLRQNEIGRRIPRIKMRKVFQHCKRQMLGGIDDPGTGIRPSSTEEVNTLSVEGRASEAGDATGGRP